MKNDFGAKLRAARQGSKLTMKQLAHGAGVSIATITNLETGGKKPQQKTLEKLSKFLGSKFSSLESVSANNKRASHAVEQSLPHRLGGSSLEDMLREIDRRGFTVQIAPKLR